MANGWKTDFEVQGVYGSDDGQFESVFDGEGLMSEMKGFEILPGDLDAAKFGRISHPTILNVGADDVSRHRAPSASISPRSPAI